MISQKYFINHLVSSFVVSTSLMMTYTVIANPSGLKTCPKGVNGSGGLYNSGAARCDKGVIIPSGMSFCAKGVNGGGGLYNSGAARCDKGKIVK
jgi:hypothetical protein